MNLQSTRSFLLNLPHVVETLQWGDNLVFWAGEKQLGGKMFALLPLAPDATPARNPGRPSPVLSFHAGPARYPDLLEVDGLCPAPYLARAHWIALDRWSAVSSSELQDLLRNAHALILARLPRKARAALNLLPDNP